MNRRDLTSPPQALSGPPPAADPTAPVRLAPSFPAASAPLAAGCEGEPEPWTAAEAAWPGPEVQPALQLHAPASPADSPVRRELRRRHVGSSEAAALFNLSPHTTRLELYLRKRGELAEPALTGNERVLWGLALEAAIGEATGERMGWTVRKVRRYVVHPGVAGMGCSLDFEIVNHPRGTGVLEIKTVDRLAFRDWPDGRPPIHYELQLQHQLACSRRGWGAIGVLIGGNELRVFPYDRHPGAIDRLEREVEIFWREVLEGRPPRPDYRADLATLSALYRHANPGSFLDLRHDARVGRLCQEYTAAAAAEHAARERREAARAELLHLIGDAETVWADGYRISACTVEGGPVEYVRDAYRSLRVSPRISSRKPAHAAHTHVRDAHSQSH
jgi:YqaJ-like viral recombinase domain